MTNNLSFSPAPPVLQRKYRFPPAIIPREDIYSLRKNQAKSLNKTITHPYNEVPQIKKTLPLKAVLVSDPSKIKDASKRNNELKEKKSNLKNLAKKYRNNRQNSLLTIATKTSSKYYTSRQSNENNTSSEKFPSFKLPMIKLNDQK